MTRSSRLVLAIVGFLYFAAMSPVVRGQDAKLAKKINDAIDKGLEYLKNYPETQLVSGRSGGSALRGWTLLEGGVPPNDAVLKKLVDHVRGEAPGMAQVYDLALAILFLDKLGDPGDEPLIESMAVRLLACQGAHGGWTYMAPKPNEEERSRLVKLIQDTDKLRSEGQVIRNKPRGAEEINQDIARQVKALDAAPAILASTSDNSNTQFAMMAIWVARRHGLPVQKSLALVGKRFRSSQFKTGEWSYQMLNEPFSHPAMTCAGLLGLALAEGAEAKPKDLSKDPQVQRGMEVLAKAMNPAIAKPLDPSSVVKPPPNLPVDPKPGVIPNPNVNPKFPLDPKPALIPNPAVNPNPPLNPGALPIPQGPLGVGKMHNYYYFLWSVERVAVVYNLKNLGDRDWYLSTARELTQTQAADGSWAAGYSQYAADTCFALLFLKRANVAKDLTELLDINPIRKGLPTKKPAPKDNPKDLPDNLFDPPKLSPKDAPKEKALKQSHLQHRNRNAEENRAPSFSRIFSGPNAFFAFQNERCARWNSL